MNAQADGDYIAQLRARAHKERSRARTLRDPQSAQACLQLAERYEAVASAYDRLGSSRGG